MNRELRIGDHERDAAVTALGEHYVAGRLTKEEFDERTAVAWQAKTNSDLAPLFYDLPPLPAPQRQSQPTASTAQPTRQRLAGFPVLPVLLLVFIVALAARLPIGPLLLVVLLVMWAKASYWRRRAWRHQRRPIGSGPTAPPWQQRRPY